MRLEDLAGTLEDFRDLEEVEQDALLALMRGKTLEALPGGAPNEEQLGNVERTIDAIGEFETVDAEDMEALKSRHTEAVANAQSDALDDEDEGETEDEDETDEVESETE